MVKPLRIEQKQDSKNEKPKLDNARRLRGIYFLLPDDQHNKETLKMRGEYSKDLWQQPCRAKGKLGPAPRKWLQSKKFRPRRFQTMICGCTVEPHESTRQRQESSSCTEHEERLAGTGYNSMTHCNLVHKFIAMPQALKIPDGKAAVDKEWKKLETIPSMAAGESSCKIARFRRTLS